MQILHLASGQPSCLLDWRFFDVEKAVYTLPNCGAAPTWFARRSFDPAINLRHIRVVPAITKYAGGGAHIEFTFGAGPVTLARLSRSLSGYKMLITRGDLVEHRIQDVKGSNPQWPHAFLSHPLLPDALISKVEANHIHLVAGDYIAELEMICRFLGIEPMVI